jgi:hypothetical protein
VQLLEPDELDALADDAFERILEKLRA